MLHPRSASRMPVPDEGANADFFGTPRGFGLATATTSAAFPPHCEDRIRGASSWKVSDQPTRRARASAVMPTRARH
jgi:hypothetical protein